MNLIDLFWNIYLYIFSELFHSYFPPNSVCKYLTFNLDLSDNLRIKNIICSVFSQLF